MDRRATEKQKELDKAKEKQQEELTKQKQIEKDLEEQSRLIAASSWANPTAADGQFLVLSNSQSEDSDAGEEGRKKGESEAWHWSLYSFLLQNGQLGYSHTDAFPLRTCEKKKYFGENVMTRDSSKQAGSQADERRTTGRTLRTGRTSHDYYFL